MRFGKPDIFGNKPVQRKKNRQIIRIRRIHQLHLIPGKGFWFYENLTGNIRDLTRFGKPDIFGNKPAQRENLPANYQNTSIASNSGYSCPCWTSPNKPGSTITRASFPPRRSVKDKNHYLQFLFMKTYFEFRSTRVASKSILAISDLKPNIC